MVSCHDSTRVPAITHAHPAHRYFWGTASCLIRRISIAHDSADRPASKATALIDLVPGFPANEGVLGDHLTSFPSLPFHPSISQPPLLERKESADHNEIEDWIVLGQLIQRSDSVRLAGC